MGGAALTFEILARLGRARRGMVRTRHGCFETPAFMPVGTAATVKGMDPGELVAAGAEIVLGNTYHLALRPGSEVVKGLGGLHTFMAWSRPILTDSGGYQVMSLAPMRRIDEDGVEFRSHIDGQLLSLTPERVVALQAELGSDIAMPLDVCPRHDEGEAAVRRAVELTVSWARRSIAAPRGEGQALFGIVQGGIFPDARRAAAEAITGLPFDGFAIGGVQVGEPSALSYEIVDATAAHLPEDRPRYVMGVGKPEDILTMVRAGIDMFDTVLPTRHARNGMLFTRAGSVVIKHARYRDDGRPLDARCGCPTCRRHSRAYLRHLYLAKEALSVPLLTRHNLQFYLDLMREIRQAISAGSLDRLAIPTSLSEDPEPA